MPTQAYRSSGRPEVTFAIERLIDAAARQARLRPHRAAPQESGAAEGTCRTATRSACSTTAAATKRTWTGRWRSPTGTASRRGGARPSARGKLLGLGLANYVESSIGAPREQARITVRPDGRVDVVIGTQPAGQGHETSFAQVVVGPARTCRSRACASSSATPMWCASAAAPIPAARCATPRRCSPRPPAI